MRTRPPVALVALCILVVTACSTTPNPPAPPPSAPAAPAPPSGPDPGLPGRLVAQVSGDGAYRHLEELQRIADGNGGNRAMGSPGYDASVDYVVGVLRGAGYQVQTPEFAARRFSVQQERLSVAGSVVPALALAYSPTTPADGVSAPLAVVDGEGCNAGAWAGVPRGAIVLVRRGTCTFTEKSTAAATAGAAGLIVVNNEEGPLSGGTLGDNATGTVPTAGLSRSDGDPLFARAGAPVTLVLQTAVQETRNRNVIAETSTGDASETVFAGAHLDSVPEGPGINDNGSGVATLLDIAVALGGAPPVANAVRFGFWGAEEEGLIGSGAYVQGLDATDRTDIALYLNLDMVGSPNSGYFVLDGDDSDDGGDRPGPPGSAALERAITETLNGAGVPTETTPFAGNSDYDPFLGAKVPSGGIYTGAGERMDAEQARRWGGRADQPFDPCYHQACDRIDTIDRVALDRNADAAAGVLARFALSTKELAAG